MPLPALAIPALISAGSQVAGTATNAILQGSANKKARKFALEMYNRQRNDALTDWARENAYNSPAAQMKRLEDAGLNPNLVYGNGAVATGGDIRSANAPHWSPEAPQVDLSGIGTELGRYHQIRLQDAQVNNLEAQKAVAEQDALLKASQVNLTTAQASKIAQDTAIGAPTAARAEEIAKISLDAQKANLQKTLVDTRYTQNQDRRSDQSIAVQAQEAMVRMAKMKQEIQESKSRTRNIDEQTQSEFFHRSQIGQQHMLTDQQIENLKTDKVLKELEIKLRRMGINDGDALPYRVVARLLSEMGIDL